MNIEIIRSRMPITQSGKVYLNHAAKSPLPQVAREASDQFFKDRMQDNIMYIDQMIEDKAALMQMLADRIGGDPERMALTQSTTEGLNLFTDSLEWSAEDEVVLFAEEFPANVFPFLKLRDLYNVKIKRVEADNHLYDPEVFKQLINPNTKAVAISYVQFLTGQVADLKQLSSWCKENGAWLVVDAIQGAGAIPMDAKTAEVDFLAGGGHKWMMMPQGIGYIYYSERFGREMKDTRYGWLDREEPFDLFNWDRPKLKDGRRFELGTGNDLGIHIARRVLEWRNTIGEEWISSSILALSDYLKQKLVERNMKVVSLPHFQSGIVSFYMKDAENIQYQLEEKGIYVSFRSGLIRIAPHFYNTYQEIDHFLTHLDEYLIKG